MNKECFENLNTYLDNTIEGVVIIKEGFIVNVNQTIIDILKYTSKDQLIGNLATGILIPNINQKYLEFNNTTFEQISLLSKDAQIIPAIIKIKDFQSENEHYKIVYVLDLTELKQKESLLLEQSRMAAMGEMISMIAHQWRQPLSAITAVTSTLKLKLMFKKFEPSNFELKLSEVDTYIKYMSKTIDDFRNFFKDNKEKEYVTLNEVVNNTLNLVQKAFEHSDIKIINNEKKLKRVYVFKNELLQVILNILNNSKDAIKERNIENPTINIFYEENQTYQKLIIEDNAGGIKEEILNKIFDPYFSTKEKQNGTGLGLYMCKTIVEQHCNGKIIASNKKDGACFEIVIHK